MLQQAWCCRTGSKNTSKENGRAVHYICRICLYRFQRLRYYWLMLRKEYFCTNEQVLPSQNPPPPYTFKHLIIFLKFWYFSSTTQRRIAIGIDSASLCSLAGRYDNPIPTQFLYPHILFQNSSTAWAEWHQHSNCLKYVVKRPFTCCNFYYMHRMGQSF